MLLTAPRRSRASTTPQPALSGFSGMPEVPSSGLPSPPSSPPLAALTSANELALRSKSKKRDINGARKSRREGAAYTIREECERLFCETMKTVFLVEKDTVGNGSSAMGMNMNSPPKESVDTSNSVKNRNAANVSDWLEIWDYAGGCSLRGFVTGTGEEKSLFAFFKSVVVGRDLKQGLMALIELASELFECSQVVICVDRSVEPEERAALLKSLRWVGFDLITLESWVTGPVGASDKWLFLGMEL